MPDAMHTKFDTYLDRVSKIAAIFLPIVVAVVGGIYTANKDKNDRLALKAQADHDEYQRGWDNTKKKYDNMIALVPLLTSGDRSKVRMALEIYTSEAKDGQAPESLQPTIHRIELEQPEQRDEAQLAFSAGKEQMASACRFDPDGLYIQVANDIEQLKDGRKLQTLLESSGVKVQGVQRIDASPKNTELRYFFTPPNTSQAGAIKEELAKHGIKKIDEKDLTKRYLKPGCNPPGTFELWIGENARLTAEGTGTG
jgi:hypothetical protein